MSEAEETFTYEVTLGVSTRYVGSTDQDTSPLQEYGYSDQDWDGLEQYEKDDILDEWIRDYVWENTDSWGEVK